MAAFDMDDPKSIVSPGGVGFDINCGVRLLRTNLWESDVLPVKVNLTFFIYNNLFLLCALNRSIINSSNKIVMCIYIYICLHIVI